MMKKHLCFLLFLIVMASGIAQDSIVLRNRPSGYIKNQKAVTVSYSKNTFIPFEIMEDKLLVNHVRGVEAQVLYGINNWLECGVALNVGYVEKLHMEGWPYPNFVLPTIQGCFGEVAKAHLLSAFWPDFFVVDLFAVEKMGVSATISTKGWPDARLCFLAQIGVGAAINFSRHFGVCAEYGISSKKNPYTLFGLNVRFGGPRKWQR